MRPLLLSIVLAACQDAKSPNEQTKEVGSGETCAVGGRAIATCAANLKCSEEPYTAPPPPDGGVQGPDKPSPVGGACGGVAGFHCADGLACDMPPDQVMVADGMGTCARASKCR